jgi:hypothetical protein
MDGLWVVGMCAALLCGCGGDVARNASPPPSSGRLQFEVDDAAVASACVSPGESCTSAVIDYVSRSGLAARRFFGLREARECWQHDDVVDLLDDVCTAVTADATRQGITIESSICGGDLLVAIATEHAGQRYIAQALAIPTATTTNQCSYVGIEYYAYQVTTTKGRTVLSNDTVSQSYGRVMTTAVASMKEAITSRQEGR